MADKRTRPAAGLILRTPLAPARGGAALATALLEDARELLSALRLRNLPDLQPEPAAVAAALADGPALLAFADVPAIPPMAIEAATEAIAGADIALGPCTDGGLYLIAARAGLDAGLCAELAECALAPDALTALADLADDAQLAVALLPPWFGLRQESALSFAESLARLSLLSEEGEEDFVADRLRVWFEEHA